MTGKGWTKFFGRNSRYFFFNSVGIAEICFLNIKIQRTIPTQSLNKSREIKELPTCTKFKDQVTKVNKRKVCSKCSK
jgi:hypothetical protein